MAVSHDLFQLPTSQIEAELAQLRTGGITWIREDLSWSVAEPRRGVFSWAPFDRLMTAAAVARVHLLGILDYSAPWASSDPSGAESVLYPPRNDGDFAAYGVAVVARYGQDGSFWAAHPSLTPDPLTAVEIWNEPFGSWSWKPSPNPGAYAALVSEAAPAIHAVDPHMTVLMSGDLQSWDERSSSTGTHAQPWLSRVLAADPKVPTLVNAIDIHPYPTPRNLGPYDSGANVRSSFAQVPLIRRTELAAGVELPIWITEIGWSTAPSTSLSVSDQTQATYLGQAIQRSLGEWGSYVAKTFVFGWYRSSGLQGDPDHNFGLLNHNGVPKPAWATITQLVGGSAAAEPCPLCSSDT